MRNASLFLLILLATCLSGCGTMNANFSCQATAGDSCLTIEQVDAMTRFADEARPASSRKNVLQTKKGSAYPQGQRIVLPHGQSVWVTKHVKETAWG
ncbi:conjugative transfer protein [Legionella beliardensis]|uniref:Conjugative transfer protein n=1 Tax=Legionella beliardensis TaxID=91822 RepID=A0A378JSP5_9GAMM|nr:TraV family lipoprotein [Legionella beliardensis]STX55693.1 conjugative transfer protein [Legionella beliardensis]